MSLLLGAVVLNDAHQQTFLHNQPSHNQVVFVTDQYYNGCFVTTSGLQHSFVTDHSVIRHKSVWRREALRAQGRENEMIS